MEINKFQIDKKSEFLNKVKVKENYSNLSKFYFDNKELIDLDSYDNDKRTPLITSVTSKNFDAVKFLLENNINVNKSDSVNIKI
jgi:ankyrin repeat protein